MTQKGIETGPTWPRRNAMLNMQNVSAGGGPPGSPARAQIETQAAATNGSVRCQINASDLI